MNIETQIQQVIQKLEQLEHIIFDQGTLGLSQGRIFVYVQKAKQSLWTFIASDEPVNAVSITGYMIDLYRKQDEVPKLHIVIRTRDAEYVLCSGFETHFSRDVMAAIAQLTPAQAKRPIKIVPTIKEPKPGEKTAQHQPVYANVLLDNRTIQTYRLKKDLSADELFQKAIAVLNGKTVNPPPGLNDKPTPASSTLNQEVEPSPVNWKGFCQQYGISPDQLKAIAHELNLPMGKLNPGQSAALYQEAYNRFANSEKVFSGQDRSQ
jgi:hypothetical protein